MGTGIVRDANGGGGGVSDLRTKVSSGHYPLYGVLIYGDHDKNLIQFLSESHKSLAAMSGNSMFLFWFEHFEKDSILLWKPGDEPKNRKLKIRRTESLQLAKALEIPMSKTPCFLICRKLDDTEMLVYSLDNTWSHDTLVDHFKAIFDEVDDLVRQWNKDRDVDVMSTLGKRLRTIKLKKWVESAISHQSIGTMLKAIATGSKFA